MSGSNILTAQTSTTGNLVSHDCRLLGFTIALTTGGAGTLSLRNSSATTGSTLLIYKWAESDLGGTVNLPEGGVYFSEGITASTAANIHSLTIYYQ